MTDIRSTIRGLSDVTETKLTDEDIARIQRISTYFNLRDNDPFISVLISLEHYFKLCKSVPDEISNYVDDERRRKNKMIFIKWVCIAVFVFSLCILGVSYYLFTIYNKSDLIIKDLVTQIENLKSYNEKNSAITPKLYDDLYFLYKNGDLEDLVYCSMRGWQIKNGECAPLPFEENGRRKVTTWKVPLREK